MATPERPLLFSERGGGLSPATVRLWFHRLYTSLKMDGCSSHSGRRTFITRAARRVSRVGESPGCAGTRRPSQPRHDATPHRGDTGAKRKPSRSFNPIAAARAVWSSAPSPGYACLVQRWVRWRGRMSPGRAARPAHTPLTNTHVGGMGKSPETMTGALCSAHAAGERSKDPRLRVPSPPWVILSQPPSLCGHHAVRAVSACACATDMCNRHGCDFTGVHA